jgi:CRP-like cAMP-binding protein
MNPASLCVTCPNRDSGFCGALLGRLADAPVVDRHPDWQRFVAVRAGEQIAVRNNASGDVFVICSGWAFSYFQLSDGRRQILQFLLPGDLLSSVTIFEGTFHLSAQALTEVQVSGFARSRVREMCAISQDTRSVIAKCCVAECRYAAGLVTALGQFSAEERIAHLLLHLMERIAARSVVREQRYRLPLRQQHIADAVGLTPVHVSRVFSLFRERRIVALSEGVLQVFNLPELEKIGSVS